MKTLHLSASLSRAAGGIFEIELALARHLAAQGVGVRALGLEDGQWKDDAARWQGLDAGVFPSKGPGSFGYAPGLLPTMMKIGADIAHLHTLWMYPSVAIRQWSQRTRNPYVATPNGMLEPWALGNSAWKKKLAGFLYENKMLHGAACLQANTEKELRDFRAYGLKNPVCVIPNGVELPEETGDRGQGSGVRSQKTEDQRKMLLFLGRLHPKKGIANALRAWRRCQETGVRGREEWQFVIAGWDQGGHGAELKALCDELGLAWSDIPAAEFVGISTPTSDLRPPTSSSAPPTPDACPLTPVLFTGPAFGETKAALLRQSDAFILPSFSEGLPMSVLEAWAYGLPVLMTDHCNLPEGFAADAAMRIGTGVRGQESGVRGQPMGIDEGMCTLMAMSDSERVAMGQRGRALVEERFTWPQVAAQMKEVYEWVLGDGERPDCVSK